jgi:hypothetical protein
MTPEELQKENELLRTIINQRTEIDNLKEEINKQTSINSRFRQILMEMLNNGFPYQYKSDDFSRGCWFVHGRWLDRARVLLPNFANKYSEFKEIVDKITEMDETVLAIAAQERERARSPKKAKINDRISQ